MNVRVARTQADWEAIWRLTCNVYQQQGYAESPGRDRSVRYHSHLDQIPETTAFILQDEGQLAGTISVTEDSKRGEGGYGLHTDASFPEETEAIRQLCDADNERLGASWRIVTDPKYRHSWVPVITLITEAIKEMIERRLDVIVLTLHPRHERIYSRLLGVETLAGIERDATVCGAPALLMVGRLDKILSRWRERV